MARLSSFFMDKENYSIKYLARNMQSMGNNMEWNNSVHFELSNKNSIIT